MGQIICQTCGETIEFYDAEKVTVLYGQCPKCHGGKCHTEKK